VRISDHGRHLPPSEPPAPGASSAGGVVVVVVFVLVVVVDFVVVVVDFDLVDDFGVVVVEACLVFVVDGAFLSFGFVVVVGASFGFGLVVVVGFVVVVVVVVVVVGATTSSASVVEVGSVVVVGPSSREHGRARVKVIVPLRPTSSGYRGLQRSTMHSSPFSLTSSPSVGVMEGQGPSRTLLGADYEARQPG
jgi:hypothetical protein